MEEKLWEFATEKELKEWEILKNEGAFECMNWLNARLKHKTKTFKMCGGNFKTEYLYIK